MFQRMVFMMIQNRVYLHRCLYIHPDAVAIARWFNKTVAKNAVQPSGGALTTACAPMAALIPPARCPRPPLGSSFLDIRSATGRATPSTEAPGWKGQIMRNGPDAKRPPGAAGALRPGQAPVTCAGARSRKPLPRMVCSCMARPPPRRAPKAPRGCCTSISPDVGGLDHERPFFGLGRYRVGHLLRVAAMCVMHGGAWRWSARRSGRHPGDPSVASPIICRSALAIEAHRGVASLANTLCIGCAMRLALRSDGCAQPTTSDP